MSILFNGVNNYINFGDPATLDFGATQDFSIVAWVNSTGSANDQWILRKRAGGSLGTAAGYGFRILASGNLAGLIDDGSSDFVNYDSGVNAEGAATCVAMTVDRDSSTGFKLWKDATQAGSSQNPTAVGSLANSAQLDVGGYNGGNESVAGHVLALWIYNRVLSQQELEIHAKCRLHNPGGSLENGLIFRPDLTTGTPGATSNGATIRDRSTSGINGTGSGGTWSGETFLSWAA